MSDAISDPRPPSILPEFGQREHQYMGDAALRGTTGAVATLVGKGKELKVSLGRGIDLALSFGDVVSMAGDFFGSIDDMRKLADNPGKGPDTLEELRYVQAAKVRMRAKDSDFSPEIREAVLRRGRSLEVVNFTHYLNPRAADRDRPARERNRPPGDPDSSGACYVHYHERALREAHTAGTGKSLQLEEALACEAFACHFLTDSFAGGHLRTPRRDVQDRWDRLEPTFFDKFKAYMAHQLATQLKHHRKTVGAPWILNLATFSFVEKKARAAIEQVLKGNGIPPVGLGVLIAMAVHDNDNHVGVKAKVGDETILLYGDDEVVNGAGELTEHGQETFRVTVAAVRASVAEVNAAFEAGKAKKVYADWASSLLTNGMYAAEHLLPLPLADNEQPKPLPKWDAATWKEMLADSAMQEALKLTGQVKGSELESMAQALEEPYQRQAFLRGIVEPLRARPIEFLTGVFTAKF